MKSKILVDSNVLIDIYSKDSKWYDWSAKNLSQYANKNSFVINPIIYAEISFSFNTLFELDKALIATNDIQLEDLPAHASKFVASSLRTYRKNGGKQRILADLLIGAHAYCNKMQLLTRDKGNYRTYFPHVRLISPE